MLLLSLAPIKYRKLLDAPNSIIQSIEYSEKEIAPNQLGYESYITLQDTLVSHKTNYSLYANHHGTGTSKYQHIAIYKGISEALERWAFYSIIQESSQTSRFCFDINCSTDGMASFPGPLKSMAKIIAFFEAVERYAIVHWWMGYLPAKILKHSSDNLFSGIEIITPFKNTNTVIVYQKIDEHWIYGFAASNSIKNATEKALIELYRNKYIITQFYNCMDTNYQLQSSLLEKRLVFFSSEEGNQIFNLKIQNSLTLHRLQYIPEIMINKEIIGPWSYYTTVWRTLIKSDIQENNEVEFFKF